MSDKSEVSPDAANNHSPTEVAHVEVCDKNGLGEDEPKLEVLETTPLPPVHPVRSLTTSSSVADITDNDSELLEIPIPGLDTCSGVVKVEFGSNTAEDDELLNYDSRNDQSANDQSSRSQEFDFEVPPFYEQTDYSSVACQTDWSWLTAYQAIKDKLPQKSSSTLKSKPGSKISKLSDADLPVTTEAPASSVFDDPDQNARMLDSLKSDPFPDRTDEYGIPIYSSDEEEEFIKKEDEEDEDDEDEDDDDEDEDDDDEDDDDEDDEEDDELEESLEAELTGICRFCGKEKKPFPSLEDQESKPPEELYCCSEFREYITHLVTKHGHRKVGKHRRSTKTGSAGQRSRASSSADSTGAEESTSEAKALRKKARDDRRASEALTAKGKKKKKTKAEKKKSWKERKKERREARLKAKDVDRPCIVYGREMTTINYQLSSRQCMNWTIILDQPSGATAQRQPESVHVVEPVQLQGRWSHPGASDNLLCQTYDNGSPFLVIFSDGSGNVFYPSGQNAVSIITSRDGEYLYIIQDTNGRLLGIYEPNGRTVTYNQNGSVRVRTDETGGLEMDTEGNRRKQWRWNESGRHVHAPPLYHITCSISSSFTFSISSQNEMILLFERSRRACRFNVASSPRGVLTKKRPSNLLAEELYIRDIKLRISAILQKTSTLLKLPASPRLDVSLTPVPLQKRRGTPSSTTQRRGGSRMLPAINH